MEKPESLADFYRRKFGKDTLPEGLGHFNLFRLEPQPSAKAEVPTYRRRDFYKVMLIRGKSRVHYADRVIEVDRQALSFSNPQIPYQWEHCGEEWGGYYCVFDEYFSQQQGDLGRYSVFQPGGEHIFELSEAQQAQAEAIFLRMFDEISSDYLHKYDLLGSLLSQLLHLAMKMQPSARQEQPAHAAQRISALFLELLERQYPLDDSHPSLCLRTASDFAGQLNIHVNHLNRVLRATLQKSTSQLIAERMLQEAKVMLRQSRWSVAEIAYALGFKEAPHFNHFFRKHTQLSPTQFRQGE